MIGAGAIGGCIGGVLARTGVPVVLFARGRNAEVLAAQGLTPHTPVLNLHNVIRALSAPGVDVDGLRDAVIREAEDVLRRMAIDFVSFETSTAARVDGPTPRPVPGFDDAPGDSTSQSLARGTGNVETDYLNGEIVRLANRLGVSAPINAALTRAARAAADAGAGPGGFTAQQLSGLVNPLA